MTADPLPVAVVLGGSGWLAGTGARVLLGRLRRGVRVGRGWCECGLALLWAANGAWWAVGLLPTRWLPVLLALGWLAVTAAAVDLLRRRLPDALTLPALPVALLLLTPLGSDAVARAAIGAAVAAAVHACVHLAAPRALGAGDVKLAAPLGAVLAACSWPAPVLAALLAALFTGALAAVAVAGRVLDRRAALPHGPSMLLAAWLVAATTAGG